MCLRFLTIHADRVWVICVKEFVTVAAVGPCLVYWTCRGRLARPPLGTLAALLCVGLLTQLGANLPAIWAMSVVGLVITIPVVLGVNLMSSAVLGRLFLGERVSFRSGLAIGLLIVSICLLSLGAEQANASIAAVAKVATGPLWIGLAVATACLTGAIYAMLSVVIRSTATNGTPLSVVMFLITVPGVLTLGPLSFWWQGATGLLNTPPRDFAVMLAAGVLNLLAFLAIIKGLQLTAVVRANVLTASQVAMAVVAGMLFFGEPPNPWLLLGVSLTVVGMVLIDRSPGSNRDTLADVPRKTSQTPPPNETKEPDALTTVPGEPQSI